MKGIYRITNLINGDFYIGATTNIKRRFIEHKKPYNILNGTTLLKKAFKEFGVQNFSFEVIENPESIDLLIEREQFWIKKLNPAYNTVIGKGRLGIECDYETKQKLSFSAKLQWNSLTEEEKQKRLNRLTGPGLGHSVTIESRNKLRQINLGKKHSESTISKISLSNQLSMIGNSNGNKEVLQLKDGNVIRPWDSLKEAAEFFKIHPSNITKCLKGKQKTAAGYSWEYRSVETNSDECNCVGVI